MKNFIAPGFRSKNYEERFYSKVEKSDGCWKWVGATDLYGYGRFLFKGNNTQAHRVSWIIANGNIPNGLHVLHTCDNPPCTNPEHLWLGTNTDNVADKVKKKRCRPPLGMAHKLCKLTEDQVREMRYKYDNKMASSYALSSEYNIGKSQAYEIVSRKSWKWLE